MSQKKKVRVYKPGQVDNAMSNWFMQMGGTPQEPEQPQQDDMVNQVMVYAQQMIMQGEDPNTVYDDLVDQGVSSQLAAQVLEQLMQSMPPQQPSYSQPTTAEAMYNQEVVEEEEEEAGQDFMDLAGLYDDEDDDDFEDFQKGGMTKKKFVKEYKKLALGGQKPEDVSKIQSAGFLGSVQNTFKNAKAEQEAEQMFNNPFAVNALSQFVYGGSLPKAQDGDFTKEGFDKYVKEQADRYKQLEERYKQLEQRYNQGYVNNAYGQGQGYGPGYGYGRGYGYGNVPTMFNPYGRRSPIFQRTPYLKNFPGAEFAGLQLQEFNINPAEQVDRKGLFKFLGPKTQQTWSATWSRNPVTGKIEPKKPGTTTTPSASPGATTTPGTTTTPANASGYVPKAYGPGLSGYNADADGDGLPDYLSGVKPPMMESNVSNIGKPNMTPAEYMQSQLTLPEKPFDASWQNTLDNNAGPRVNKPSMAFGGYKFQPGGDVFNMNDEEFKRFAPEKMSESIFEYSDFVNPALGDGNIDTNMYGKDEIKNALTVNVPALYDDTMYYTKGITNELDRKRAENDYFVNQLAQNTGRNEQFGNRGNYTINQLSNSSNFRPNLDGQIQYSQYGGPVVGEELEMTDEEIKKFLKGGGKLRYV